MTKTLWYQKAPARWIMPPSYGSGDRRLILAEVLFIPVRLIFVPIIWLHQAMTSVRERPFS